MNFSMRDLWLLGGLTLATGAAVAADGQETAPAVRLHGERLSLRVEHLPLGELLAALERSGRVRVDVRGDPAGVAVSDSFDETDVAKALRRVLSAHSHVLIDREVSVETAAGTVQLVGADYRGRGRKEHLEQLLARFPRRDGELRLLLLHDPSAFKHVPKGDVDLTLSGHTHGGQLGLVSFGWDWTVLRRTPFPDHGLWGHGSNRLYVHRGTGFYGFPLRIGVPPEMASMGSSRRCHRVGGSRSPVTP